MISFDAAPGPCFYADDDIFPIKNPPKISFSFLCILKQGWNRLFYTRNVGQIFERGLPPEGVDVDEILFQRRGMHVEHFGDDLKSVKYGDRLDEALDTQDDQRVQQSREQYYTCIETLESGDGQMILELLLISGAFSPLAVWNLIANHELSINAHVIGADERD